MALPKGAVIGGIVVVLVGGAVWMQTQSSGFSDVKSNSYNMKEVPRHPVTDAMASTAKAQKGKPAPEFKLPDSEGAEKTLADIRGGKPGVLVMTKDGCPCSIESQPFFNKIAEHYQERVAFLGIIDADSQAGKKYKTDFSVPYPMLSNTEIEVFKQYQAKQSVYIFLISADGTLEHVWPGYSRSMLEEMNAKLAAASDMAPAPLDLQMAPEEMTSGCYFFKPVGTEEPAW